MELKEIEDRVRELKNNLQILRYKEANKIEIVSQEDFEKAQEEFKYSIENKGSLYPLFTKLIKRGDRLEAYLFILATWNFAGFRYLINAFDLNRFNESINNLEPFFMKFEGKDVKNINFDEFITEITEIYTVLSKQVKSVGATKIMHLRTPKVFIMWDTRIRKYYGFKEDSARSYIDFLKKMQEKFKDLEVTNEDRTVAKAIDEYNYAKITKPLMNLEKEVSNLKKAIKERANKND